MNNTEEMNNVEMEKWDCTYATDFDTLFTVEGMERFDSESVMQYGE